jgi:hypothetical protein
MTSDRAIEIGIPNPTSEQSKRLGPLLFITFNLERGGPRKTLPTGLIVPASLREAEEGGREMLAAPSPPSSYKPS